MMISSRNIPLSFCFDNNKLNEIIERKYINGTGAVIFLEDDQYLTIRNYFAQKQIIDDNALSNETRERRKNRTVPIGTHNNFFVNVGSHLGLFIGFVMECDPNINYSDNWFFDEDKLQAFFHVCKQIYLPNTFSTKAKSISLLLKYFQTKHKFTANSTEIFAALE